MKKGCEGQTLGEIKTTRLFQESRSEVKGVELEREWEGEGWCWGLGGWKTSTFNFDGVAVGHGISIMRWDDFLILELNYGENMDFQKERMGCRAHILISGLSWSWALKRKCALKPKAM